jgi:hypothetical protein
LIGGGSLKSFVAIRNAGGIQKTVMNPPTRHHIQCMPIDPIFEIFDNEEEAIKNFFL